MRETKFRGKRFDNNHDDWIYGHLHVIDTCGEGRTGKAIQQQFGTSRPFSVRVREESIGEYTGLKDKNGKEIYEGDIVRCNYMGFAVFNVQVKFGQYHQDGSGAEYSPTECIGFYAEAINKEQVDEFDCRIVLDYLETTSLLGFDELEIIGNIYENPFSIEGELT